MANYYKFGTNLQDRTYFTSVVNTNNGAKRYFSNYESEIYFGNKEMEDIYKFDFQVEEKILPIYGYNCFYASELVSGQRLVQGQFVVNFTNNKYIQSTLSEIEDSVYTPVYNDQYCPGGGRDHAIWDKNFDIMLGYGYYGKDNATYNATCQTIVGAKITNMEKVMDTSGQPLLEVYNFVAKDFVEESIGEATTNTSSNNNKNNTEVKDKENIKAAVYCSDRMNTTDMNEKEALAKKNSGYHIIHELNYANGYITLHILGSDNEELDLAAVNIIFNEELDSKTVIPKTKFESANNQVASLKVDSKYKSIIEKCGKQYIKCTLEYTIDITKNGKAETQVVTYKDAKLYL